MLFVDTAEKAKPLRHADQAIEAARQPPLQPAIMTAVLHPMHANGIQQTGVESDFRPAQSLFALRADPTTPH